MLKQGLCKLTSFTPRKIKITGLKLKSPGKGYAPPFTGLGRGHCPPLPPPCIRPCPGDSMINPWVQNFTSLLKA